MSQQRGNQKPKTNIEFELIQLWGRKNRSTLLFCWLIAIFDETLHVCTTSNIESLRWGSPMLHDGRIQKFVGGGVGFCKSTCLLGTGHLQLNKVHVIQWCLVPWRTSWSRDRENQLVGGDPPLTCGYQPSISVAVYDPEVSKNLT